MPVERFTRRSLLSRTLLPGKKDSPLQNRASSSGTQEPTYKKPTVHRREFLNRAFRIATAAAAIYGTHMLKKGVSLSPYPIEPHPLELNSDVITLINQAEAEGQITSINANDRLFFEAGNKLFGTTPDIKVAHRSGNSIEAIKEAYGKGTQVFDIDANDVGGKVYGEHGIVPSIKIGKKRLRLPFVIDVNEKKFKLGEPKNTLKEIVDFVGGLSTSQKPLGVSIELKRGEFKETTMYEMFEILKTNKVPAIIKIRSQEELEVAKRVQSSQKNQFILLAA